MTINQKFVSRQLGGNDVIGTPELVNALLDKADDEIPALDAMLLREAAERLQLYQWERQLLGAPPIDRTPTGHALPHLSDCAVHNAPAEPNGRCNCGAEETAARLLTDLLGSLKQVERFVVKDTTADPAETEHARIIIAQAETFLKNAPRIPPVTPLPC